MNYLEHTPQDLLLALTGDIMVVERSGSSVNYYTSSSNPQGIFTVTYADAAAAQAAVDAFLLAANPPIPTFDIEVGDEVTIRFSPRGSESNRIYRVEKLKTDKSPYWLMSRNNDLLVFDTPITIRKNNGAQDP